MAQRIHAKRPCSRASQAGDSALPWRGEKRNRRLLFGDRPAASLKTSAPRGEGDIYVPTLRGDVVLVSLGPIDSGVNCTRPHLAVPGRNLRYHAANRTAPGRTRPHLAVSTPPQATTKRAQLARRLKRTYTIAGSVRPTNGGTPLVLTYHAPTIECVERCRPPIMLIGETLAVPTGTMWRRPVGRESGQPWRLFLSL